jgi:putative transposase
MDKSGANYAGLANINLLLILAGFATMIDICQVKGSVAFPSKF